MITVLVYTESRFPADKKKIREFVAEYLLKKITGTIEVGISIVGDRKMKMLNTKYRNVPEPTDVLSFPLIEGTSPKDIRTGFKPELTSPDETLRLGDVIVSYPQAVMEAAEENKMVNDQLKFLIAHGLDHLLGIHHD